MSDVVADDLPDIRITDPYIKQRVSKVRDRYRSSTLTKLAGQMLLERIAQLEMSEAQPASSEPASSAS
jgi:hypothetical protein